MVDSPIPPAGKRARPEEPHASTSLALPDRSRGGWASRNKDKWTCQQPMQVFEKNEFLALELDRLADIYATQAGQQWRQFSFSKAAKTLRGLTFEVRESSQLQNVRGFGDKMLQKVAELLATGQLHRTEALQSSERNVAIMELCQAGVEPGAVGCSPD